MKKQIFAAAVVAGLAQTAFADVVSHNYGLTRDTSIEDYLPHDGSSCDPSVIAANVARLNSSGVLEHTAIKDTPMPASGHCYGFPCPGEVSKAKKVHCAKAGKLQKLVDALDAE